MILIVGYDVEFGNYVGSLKNYDQYNGAKRLILDLKGSEGEICNTKGIMVMIRCAWTKS